MVATVEYVFVDPFAAEKKVLRRYMWYVVLAFVLCLSLLAGAAWVMLYSGKLSMQAFEELPRYRVNQLMVDYREAVKSFDDSNSTTQNLLQADETDRVLRNARTLPESILTGEQDFAAALTLYAEITNTIVAQAGTAREWNQLFQAKLSQLQAESEKRQIALSAIVETLPAPADVGSEQSAKSPQ